MEEDGPPPGYSDPLRLPSTESVEWNLEEENEQDGPPPGYALSISSHHPFSENKIKEESGEVEEKEEHCPLPIFFNSSSESHNDSGQMVCGSCRQLLAYPSGARYVHCPCCEKLNYVLEAHQVGQVKCSGCALLLMYPYGASKVMCSTCLFMTNIEEDNRRLPLSVQQAQATAAPYYVH